MRLAIVGNGIAVVADNDGGIVVLRVRGPSVGQIHLFGIANNYGAVVFEGLRTRPERADAGSGGLEVGGYFL